ncbi:DsrE family protein [Pampinifervens florentissimum]|uniref:DsrE family protein n=1 Tax=Pampinifervens florentissimum TaxID=1632019 RepID=UPI0013B49B9B|nr:DsrE family protein [Hydrogenobacter sp. T-8]QID33346.1 sulfur reduction protein DsrE [Hydrogenobacter sp. T-8]
MKVVILMTSGPRTPWRCASPFYIAALMAANEAEVEMFFNMDGTRLLKKGVAEKITPAEPNCLSPNGKKLKSVYDFMKDAKQAGVKFYSCKQAIDSMGYKPEDLIPELDGVFPASEFALRAMEADKVLTF